ncbi:MAG: glycoside hydrolase family 88 protein, partial [Prevotella pectinovora]|uniref:glycoside hydrolase family 88 protein n=1 Tax=Prevotella pectinovora TaxID=1602169 RepID=UPI002A8132D4
MKKEEQSFGCGISMSQKGHALSGWILRIVPLFAMLFATVVAKAAGDGDGVKFNPGVRYSQWAINSRLHDFYGNTKLFGFDVYDANNTKKSTVQWKNDKKGNIDKSFDYVAGLVAKATLEAADYYAGFDWSKPWFYSAQAFANEVTYSNDSKPTLDAMNAVKMYFPILSSSLKSDNVVKKANTALTNLAKDMKNYNTVYSIGGSKSSLNESNASVAQKQMFGGWFHKSSDYVDQMWLDGAYMGSATLAQLTGYLGDDKNIFGSKEADWNMVAKQLNIVWNQCWDSNKQLMYHAFSATGDAKASTETNKTWAGISNSADAPVYHSAAFWGRANSWYFFALVDALEAMKNDKQENTENYKTLKSHLDSFAAGIVKWQDQTTGGWYQVMDEKGDYKASNYNSSYRWTTSYNNYIETSATAIFSAALFKAVRLGLLGDTYRGAAKKAFEGIVNNFVAPKADGTINIWSSSRSAGLGGKNYRDGSKIYYILGTDTKIVTKEDNLTEGKVLGGFIMAATEYERAYQNQDGSAQILFSYDLKPSYDLTQSGATAPKVEVCGTGAANATYQWYDANTDAAVKGATEAQFIPQTTGNYYCKATVDNTSIQTSATNIKVNNTGGGETGGETTTETVFSYDVPASGELSTTDTNEGVTGGKIMFASKTNAGGKYKIDNDTKKYVKVTLSGNSLKAGDVISVKASASNSGYGCFAALDTDKKTTLKLGNLTGEGPEDISYTVTEKDILNGQSSFYLFRETGKSIYVHSITITRKTTTQTTSPLVIAVEDVEMNVTDEETKQPEVKVYGTADKLLTLGSDYTLSFSTDNNNVTINENGVFTAAGSKSNY